MDLLYDGSDAKSVFLSSEGADLIILDINLPSMDGLEVFAASDSGTVKPDIDANSQDKYIRSCWDWMLAP